MTFIPEVYHEIIKLPELEHAIVAGGYVRDKIMGGETKDLDIFIPANNLKDFNHKINILKEKNILKIDVDNFIDQGQYVQSPTFLGKYDAKSGDLDVDLCGYLYNSIHPFGFDRHVLGEFNFDIDRVFSRGFYPVIFEEAQKDMNHRTATFSHYSHQESAGSAMYRAAMKFERLRTKYPDLRFNSSLGLHHEDHTKLWF